MWIESQDEKWVNSEHIVYVCIENERIGPDIYYKAIAKTAFGNSVLYTHKDIGLIREYIRRNLRGTFIYANQTGQNPNEGRQREDGTSQETQAESGHKDHERRVSKGYST